MAGDTTVVAAGSAGAAEKNREVGAGTAAAAEKTREEAASAVDVTVVVPCYNVADYLVQCLDSIAANDRVVLEVLVVNDGSKDNTLSIAQEAASHDTRFRVIDKPNGGYGAAVNRGFSEARGRYVAIVEPDDYLEPHMFDDLFELAARYATGGGENAAAPTTLPSTHATSAGSWPDIVKSSYWRIVMPQTPQEERRHCLYYGRITPAHQPFTLAEAPRLIQHHPSIWSALYRRDFLREEGIAFLEAPGAGWVDNPFLIQTMLAARSIVYTDSAYYNYREDLPTSSSKTRTSTLPFERLDNMFCIIEGKNVQNMGILTAFYTIGFRYCGEAIANGGLEDPVMRPLIVAAFERMRPDVIMACTNVSPGLRKLAFELTGRPVPALSKVAYYKNLVREFAYTARVEGLAFATRRIGLLFHR